MPFPCCSKLSRAGILVLAIVVLDQAGWARAGDEAPARVTVPAPAVPHARLDISESDVTRVVLEGRNVQLLLGAAATERLRRTTAATVGGKLSLVLDGTPLLEVWVAGEIPSGSVVLQDVQEPLRARFQDLAGRLASGGAGAK